MDNNNVIASKSLIEKARNEPAIMTICRHEYLCDYGKLPPEEAGNLLTKKLSLLLSGVILYD